MQVIPADTPEDVREVAFRYYSGTTSFRRLRIHAWSEQAVVVSTPAGKHWSGIGQTSYHRAEYVLLPRDPAKVSMLTGAVQKWQGRLSTKAMLAALNTPLLAQ